MNVDNLARAIEIELEKYSQDVADKVKEYTEEVAKECVQELKLTSPVSWKTGGKHYALGWTYKKEFEDKSGVRYRIRNKTKPQLTHLLEYGYAKTNGGRVEAIPHIKKAEENAKEKLIKMIKGNW